MQNNLLEKDVGENKRLSTSTSISLSVATSASPSLLSESSNGNSLLSKSPTPSSFSNFSNNGVNQISLKESKSDDKKKFKKVFHKIFKSKIFTSGNNGHLHVPHHHKKNNSYSHSMNGDNEIYENNIYSNSNQVNNKLIPNANANLNKNAITVSTSRPASLLYDDNKNSPNQINIDNNYLTTPYRYSQSNEETGNKKAFPLSYYNLQELKQKLKNETENNMCTEKLSAREFAAEVGIPIIEEDEDSDIYMNNHHTHHPSFNSINGTYCSTKSYGPRLDLSIFDPPTEKCNESMKSTTKSPSQDLNENLNNKDRLSLESFFDSKNSSNENIEIVNMDGLQNNETEHNLSEKKDSDKKLNMEATTPTRPIRTKKLSRFEIEVLNGTKNITPVPPKLNVNTTGSLKDNSPYVCYSANRTNSTGSCYLNSTSSLPNLDELNKILNKNNGYHTTPSSPARRDYGISISSERNDNVYFNVGGSNQIRRPKRVSISKHSSVEDKKSIKDESKKSKLKVIIDTSDDDSHSTPSTTSSTSSVSPVHFEVHRTTSTTSSNVNVYCLDKGSSSRDMTTIITPATINDNDSVSASTSTTTTPNCNIPSAEELKNIWIDKTIGSNSNHVNKYHITNFQTEISKADKTIHTTTASHIQDAMTNMDSVVFPIQIIKTPVNNKCNTCNDRSVKKNGKSSLSESITIDDDSSEKEKSQKVVSKDNDKHSEDGSGVVQIIQKGRFTVMKEHHDYKHAIPHHYKFVIIKNPSSNVLLPQTNSESSVTLPSISSYSDINSKSNHLNLEHSHKETLSTIITPTTSAGLSSDQLHLPSLNVSPPESPSSSRSPSLSTISIPHQQLANIAAASLSSNLNLSEGIAYTTTIDSNCNKSSECCNKNEEHVLIVPTNDEKQNNLTCIQSFTSTTKPLSSSLYISTITPTESTSITKEFSNNINNGLTTTPIKDQRNSISSQSSREFSSNSSPILFNQITSTNTSPSIKPINIIDTNANSVPAINLQQGFKLEPSQIVSLSTPNLKSSIASSSQVSIPSTSINKSSSSILYESKPPLSPPIYPTLNSNVTLVNNQNVNQNSILSEDLSIYTNISDDTYIHNDSEINIMRLNINNNNNNTNSNSNISSSSNSKLCEEINYDYNKPILHSETEIRKRVEREGDYLSSIRKTNSEQYPNQIKPFTYSYDSLDRENSLNVFEPLDIEEEDGNHTPIDRPFVPSKAGVIEITPRKIDREVVTSPCFNKETVNKRKKYFPTQSTDEVIHPPEYERKNSYYDYDQNEHYPSLERKYSDMSSVDSSYYNKIGSEFERNRAYSMSSTFTEENSKYSNTSESRKNSLKSNSIVTTNATNTTPTTPITATTTTTTTTTTTNTNNEYPRHHPHHHHFFVISNSEADLPSSQIKYKNDYISKDNINKRIVISSRQHRKFDITTSSKTKVPSISTTKTINSHSTSNLLHHKRTPSNSSNLSSHSRFTIIRESSVPNKSVDNINDKSSLSTATSATPKKQSRFTVTRQAIN